MEENLPKGERPTPQVILLPTRTLLSNDVVVGLALWDRDAGVNVHPPSTPRGTEARVQVVLDRAVLNVEDDVARMAVVRAAGIIIRTRCEKQENFQKVPPQGAEHNRRRDVDGLDMSEAELSKVQLTMAVEDHIFYRGNECGKSLVQLVDPDKWMAIPLAMSTGGTRTPEDGAGDCTENRGVCPQVLVGGTGVRQNQRIR